MTTAVAEETTSQTAAENSDDPQTEQTGNEAESPESSDVANDATSPDPPAYAPPKPRLSRLERLELHQSSIMQAERAVADADADWTSAKEDAKECKKVYDARVLRLREVIRQDPDQYGLPFPTDDAGPSAGESADGTAAPEPEPWRAVTLDELGITGKLAENLANAELHTLGDIADFTSSGTEFTEIEGIGPAKAEQINAATMKFWESYKSPDVAETAQDDEQGDDEEPDDSGDDDDEDLE